MILPDLTLSSGFYKIASCLFFALMNIVIKNIPLPAIQIACMENIFGAFLLFLFSKTYKLPQKLKEPPSAIFAKVRPRYFPYLYWIRAMCAMVSTVLWTKSVQKLPLLQTVAMGFLSPFVTILGARFFLKEALSFSRIMAIFLALISGTLISCAKTDHFSQGLFNPWLFAPLIATVLFSVTNLLSKSLLSTHSPLVLTRSLMGITGLCLLVSTYDQWIPPSKNVLVLVSLLGILAAIAHICAHLAMARADVSALLPLGVIKLMFTGILAWVFFNELPSLGLLCGMIFGIAAFFCLSWRSKK
jgi:drug/metabolite transporter (DMT)-like permease